MKVFFDDAHALRELMLFAEHTGALYPARAQLENSAKRQMESGDYSIPEWQKIWRGWFDTAATMYVKEFPGGDPATLFPPRIRDAAAVEWEEYERVYVGEGSGAGGPLFGGAKPNPVSRAGYRRKAALDRDLERYYSGCMPSAMKRFKEKRAKSYCSGVAWKVARSGGKYPDYFRGVDARENPLAMGSTEKVAIGVGIAAGLAAIVYYFTTAKPATVVTPPALPPGGEGSGNMP